MARGRSSGRRGGSKYKTKGPRLPFGTEDVIAGGFTFLAVLLGGASAGGFIANGILQLASALLIAWGIATLDWGRERRSERAPLWFAVLLAGWMLVQLIPLPPALWTALPGRQPVVEGLNALQITPLPWMPISLLPAGTLAGVAAMLPPIAAIVMVLRFGRNAVQFAIWGLFAAAALSVVLGMAQLSAGAGSPLYLYAITNVGQAVGTFSNSNHLATLLLIVLPMVAGITLRTRARRDESGGAQILWVAAPAVAVLALLGVLAAGSLAGILLTPIALLAGFLILRVTMSLRTQLIVLGSGALVLLVAVLVVMFSPSVGDFGKTSLGNENMSRGYMWPIAEKAAQANLPAGAGYGAFPPVFRARENPDKVTRVYANHAHSDLIETVVEGGVPTVLLLLAFLFWYLRRSWRLWFRYGSRDPIACAASAAVLLVLLHSLVDYPLRTAAIAVPFALCVALMARAQRAATANLAAETPSARHLSV